MNRVLTYIGEFIFWPRDDAMQHVYVTDDNMVHMPGCYDVPWSIFCDWCWSELP